MAALEKRQAFFEQRIEELQQRKQSLLVRAPHAGIWIENELNERKGGFFTRGDLLGRVVSLDSLRFVAVVTQEQASNLFQLDMQQGKIRLYAYGLEDVYTDSLQFIPFQRTQLPSPVLGWDGGGPIKSQTNDRGQVVASEPFFEVYANLPTNLFIVEGQSGKLKLALTWQPMYWQVKRFIMQLLQKRFQA
jgi:putative peptide zinc metalloprotease protein